MDIFNNQIHELEDIIVEEVSLVDRAANKRRFLVVKRDKTMQEVKLDDQGNLTTEEAAGETEVSVEAVITKALEELGQIKEIFEAAFADEPSEELTVLKSQAGELVSALGGIFAVEKAEESTEEAEETAEAEVEKSEETEEAPEQSEETPEEVEKAGRKLSGKTEAELRGALDSISRVLSSLSGKAKEKAKEKLAEAAAESEEEKGYSGSKMKKSEGAEGSAVEDRVAELEATVAKQYAEIKTLRKARPAPNGVQADGDDTQGEDDFSWPLDMNAEKTDNLF